MPATTLTSRLADGSNLDIDGLRRSRRSPAADPFEGLEQAQTFRFAQSIGTRGVVRHGLSNDVALRLAKAVGGTSNLSHGLLIE